MAVQERYWVKEGFAGAANEGGVAKAGVPERSTMSRRFEAAASRLVMAGRFHLDSTKRQSDEWSATTCET